MILKACPRFKETKSLDQAEYEGVISRYHETDCATKAMEREPECYKVFQVFTTVMGVLASGIVLTRLRRDSRLLRGTSH